MLSGGSIIERWKLYSDMTKLGEIARRYFVMNSFDGILTVLGVIIAKFILFLSGNEINSTLILIQGLAISIAIGISGITGGLLTEKAERAKNILDMRRSMAMQRIHNNVKEFGELESNKLKEEDYYPVVNIDEASNLNGVEITRIEVDPKSPEPKLEKISAEKTIAEKAENFGGIVASLINGFAPAGGGIFGLIPFLFIANADLLSFLSSFVIMGTLLFLLGVYLARISEDRIWKYSILMISAGLITAAFSFLLPFLI